MAVRPLVLVVDDSDDLRDALRSLLEQSLAFPVLTAGSGPEALGLLEVMPVGGVNLILSDYLMAPMHGLAFLEKARALHPQVPCILMTAFPDLDLAIRAVNSAGVCQFLSKPLDPDATIRVVGAVAAAHLGATRRGAAIERAARIRSGQAH